MNVLTITKGFFMFQSSFTKFTKLLVSVFIAVCVVLSAGCFGDGNKKTGGGGKSALVGRWYSAEELSQNDNNNVSGNLQKMELLKDGTGIIDGFGVMWKIDGGRIYFSISSGLAEGMAQACNYKISGSTLTLISDEDEISGFTSYEDGKLRGKWEGYYKDGKLGVVGNSDKDGNKYGEWKYYYSNGQVKNVGNYKVGNKDGKHEWFYENGKIKKVEIYKNGSKDGKWEWYYENGKLEKIEVFKDGKLEYAGSYRDGKQEGRWIWYYENGKLEKIGSYKNGNKDERWEYYYKDGKLEKTEIYENGKLDDW
jgi:antitoxin component YwqK of YwqJK toxin-antitoxin module